VSEQTWSRFPTDEMSLRGLIEACTGNDETGRTHLLEYLDMTARVKSVKNEATGETFPDMDSALEASSVYDQDGAPIFFVEHEPGTEPHSPQTVIVSLAEALLALQAELEAAAERERGLRRALDLIADPDYTHIGQLKDVAGRALSTVPEPAETGQPSPERGGE
jgi:hypothetical protein